jgi:hypothetical protein
MNFAQAYWAEVHLIPHALAILQAAAGAAVGWCMFKALIQCQ